MRSESTQAESRTVELPAPMVLALGLALIFTGMVTNIVVGILGLLLALYAATGWCFEVFPREHHITVKVQTEQVLIVSSRALLERLPNTDLHRKILPVETFHITTGIKGGIAGGVAMVVPATLFSLLKYHSLWYAMNLLAAGGFVSWAGASDVFLSQFHLQGFLAACVIHGLTSLLVGLLYGALLPMFPKYPIVSAGFMVPLLFTGILYSARNVVSPILNQRIAWFWFVASQISFGLVCGFVVNLQSKVRTPQFRALPFAIRAGIHSDDPHPKERDNEQDVPR